MAQEFSRLDIDVKCLAQARLLDSGKQAAGCNLSCTLVALTACVPCKKNRILINLGSLSQPAYRWANPVTLSRYYTSRLLYWTEDAADADKEVFRDLLAGAIHKVFTRSQLLVAGSLYTHTISETNLQLWVDHQQLWQQQNQWQLHEVSCAGFTMRMSIARVGFPIMEGCSRSWITSSHTVPRTSSRFSEELTAFQIRTRGWPMGLQLLFCKKGTRWQQLKLTQNDKHSTTLSYPPCRA